MKLIIRLFTLILLVSSISVKGQKLSDPILLWPNGAPNASGTSNEDKPAIIPFIPEANHRNGSAVLVIPGGGFVIRAKDHEGVLVAQWLKDHGYCAFLLRYRLRPIYDQPDWLRDGQRALQFIRSNAAKYNISPDRLGAVGFSAGANLCVDLAFNAYQGKVNTIDTLDRQSTNPNFIILAYGYGQMPDTIASFPGENMPPFFMYGTAEDTGSLKGMAKLHSDLIQTEIPVEAHFFQTGDHGTGFAIGDPILGQWPFLAHKWLWTNGFLTDKSRTSLSGSILIDNKPMVRGMVVMTSIDDPNAPPVIIYQNNSGTGELGRFAVPQNEGPITGKYKIEVRQGATRWVSNSRDPFMIDMMQKQRNGTLTDQDIKKWSDYHRNRDLSPSIENQRVFSRQHPDDDQDYIVEVTENMELIIEIFSE